MSQEARIFWASKKCPLGAGDSNGKCCTTECAAWKEWDTRETKIDVEESWQNHRPGWFSGWKVVDKRSYSSSKEVNDEGKERWTKGWTSYLWRRETYRSVGSAGGRCSQLPA